MLLSNRATHVFYLFLFFLVLFLVYFLYLFAFFFISLFIFYFFCFLVLLFVADSATLFTPAVIGVLLSEVIVVNVPYEVVGLRYAKYTNKAGREVSGTVLYCQYVDDRIQGVGCAEFWLPADGAQHVAIGHQITPLYNRYGRVVSVIDHG